MEINKQGILAYIKKAKQHLIVEETDDEESIKAKLIYLLTVDTNVQYFDMNKVFVKKRGESFYINFTADILLDDDITIATVMFKTKL